VLTVQFIHFKNDLAFVETGSAMVLQYLLLLKSSTAQAPFYCVPTVFLSELKFSLLLNFANFKTF